GEPLEHLAELARVLARLDHRPVDIRKCGRKLRQAARQRLALEHARTHRGEQPACARRLGLLDQDVEAFLDGESGALQRGELARQQRQALARQARAREALAYAGVLRGGADRLDRERSEAALAQQGPRVALGVGLDDAVLLASALVQRAVLEA